MNDQLPADRRAGPWMPWSETESEYLARNFGVLGDRVGGRRPALRGLPRQLGGRLRGGEVSSYGFESAREAFDYEQEGDDGGGYDDPAGWRDKYCAAIMAHEGVGSRWLVDPPIEEYFAA